MNRCDHCGINFESELTYEVHMARHELGFISKALWQILERIDWEKVKK